MHIHLDSVFHFSGFILYLSQVYAKVMHRGVHCSAVCTAEAVCAYWDAVRHCNVKVAVVPLLGETVRAMGLCGVQLESSVAAKGSLLWTELWPASLPSQINVLGPASQ